MPLCSSDPVEWGVERPSPNDQSGAMKTVGIAVAKRDLRVLIDGLANGSPVLIVDRGRPVARHEPLEVSPSEDKGRIARLVRAGIVRHRVGAAPRSLFSSLPPRPNAGSSGVATLIEGRREGQ